MLTADFIPRSALEMRIKGLERRIASFTSGAAYQKLQDELHCANHTIQALHEEVARLNSRNIRNIKQWMQVNEDVIHEKDLELQKKQKEINKLKARNWELQNELDKLREEKQKALEEKYAAEIELREQKDKMAGLTARLNKNSRNSSLPSSTNPNHDKIPNGRDKTDRKPGGQPGHKGHGRPKLKSTAPAVSIPPKPEFLDTTRFKPTGKIITKQLVTANIVVNVQEFTTPEFRDVKTGTRVHAEFPFGLRDDVTYDGSVKALAYMLNNVCNASIDHTRQFLREASGGVLKLSKGFINSLNRQFAALSEDEQLELFKALASSKVFHVDFTFGRSNGKTRTVAITCDDEGHVLYQGRPAKGEQGVKGTPAEVNPNTCVSDHEAALIKLGSRHQECLVHVYRYLKGSIENEPNLTWNIQMKEAVKGIIDYRRGMAPDEELDPEKVAKLMDQFNNALKTGKEEYEYNPPTDYYREGYNLWKRMYEKPEDYTLTLRDKTVPTSNNVAERSGRRYKRKWRQVMTFRSDEVHDQFCAGASVVESLRNKGENLLQDIAEVFNRSLSKATD